MKKYKFPYLSYLLFLLISLLTAISVAEVSNTDAHIKIDFAKNLNRVNKDIMGQMLAAFDTCRLYPSKKCSNQPDTWKYRYSNLGGGVWDAVNNIPNQKAVDLAKEIKVSTLRFPGGCGTHHYNWKEAIGPVEKRLSFRFGLDEFMTLCKVVGAEPIITLSYFTGSDQDLADMIEYLNLPADDKTQWAFKRYENGHYEPYNVKYFEFGNECYHGNHTTIGNVDPRDYAKHYIRCWSKLKKIDSNIQIGLVLQCFNNGITSWDKTVMNIVKSNVDFAIIHIYPCSYKSDDGLLNANELFKIALAAPEQFKRDIENISFYVNKLANKKVPLAITEYNGLFIQNKPVPYRHSLANALLNADLLRIYLTAKTQILCAVYCNFINSYWGTAYNHDYLYGIGNYQKRPNFYVFDLYANHFGQQLIGIEIECPRYLSPAFANVHATANELFDTNDLVKTNVSVNILPSDWRIKHYSFIKKCVVVKKEHDQICLNFNCDKDINYYHTNIILDVNSSHRYRLSAEIKTDNLISTSGVCLAVDDLRGWEKTRWSKLTRKISGTNDWQKVVVKFQPMHNAKKVRISIRRVAGGGQFSGEVWVKNCVFEDLGKGTKYSSTPFLSAIASTDTNQNKIYIIVINKNFEKPISTLVELNNSPNILKGCAWVLNGPDIDSTNEDYTNNVMITRHNIQIEHPRQFNMEFQPHSVTAVELDFE